MGQTRTRGSIAIVLAVSIAIGVNGCAGVRSSSGGSCALKSIELQDSSLHPGGVLQLHSDAVWETCEDTGGTSRAASDVTVVVTPSASGEEVLLGRPTPQGPLSTVDESFELPADLPVGPAVLALHIHSGDVIDAELPITITAPPAT
ncbi:hypothetical protein [Curtobacterium sp. MCBD17_023]|uniref:hypothetical protein n=1 Tax=Curtobacterium sp. MCBD17_023 TaxID=2175657 RepID=UPI000D831498|nr:hypothetical protein [Curtobacterium sp. MCBD17_023]PYY50821.1 hypothetical protein DEI84_03295 [Curtobacterium sp. MCBD17_023]